MEYDFKVDRDYFKRQVKFKDVDELKDGCITIPSFDDQNFQTKTLETERAIQAAPHLIDSAAQTVWRYPKNATTQYEPRTFTESEKEQILKTDNHLTEFVKNSVNL